MSERTKELRRRLLTILDEFGGLLSLVPSEGLGEPENSFKPILIKGGKGEDDGTDGGES